MYFFLFQNVPMGSGIDQASDSRVPGFISVVNIEGVNLTTDLHLVSRTRMSGYGPTLPLYTFMAS
jgi:hypothetical protein